MTRPKNKMPSVRVRLDGNIRQPIIDPREQKAMDWYNENVKFRKAFPVAWQLLIAALNGELGSRVEAAVADGNTEEAMNALRDLVGMFGREDASA